MWFSNKQAQFDVTEALSELKTNGISVTIDELLLYQAKSRLLDLSANQNLHSKMAGNYLARTKGRGMEFDEVRHYQTGDDIRAIDWRVTARTGKTHTKLFREEIERPVLIATDLGPSMAFGTQLLYKSVQACHIASLVAWHAKARGDRVGGIVFSQQNHIEVKPRSRKQGVLHYLHSLTQIQNNVPTPLSEDEQQTAFANNCLRVRQLAKPGSLVYLITDGHSVSDTALRHLNHISRHCELVVCLISDALEHALPQSNEKLEVTMSNGYENQVYTLGDERVANLYRQKASYNMRHKVEKLNKVGARVVSLNAGESLESQLSNGRLPWIH